MQCGNYSAKVIWLSINQRTLSRNLLPPQGKEETLQLEPVNGYYRRLQYQYLGSRGSPGEAGFVVEVHTPCIFRFCWRFQGCMSCMAADSQASRCQHYACDVHQSACSLANTACLQRLVNGRQAMLQLRRQTAQQAAEWQEAQLQQKEAEIHAAAGEFCASAYMLLGGQGLDTNQGEGCVMHG